MRAHSTLRICARVSIFSLVLNLVLSLGQPTLAQAQNGPPKNQDEGFGLSPIPTIAPVTEEGAGLAVVYRYHLNPQNKAGSSSSGTAIGGFITTNRSWGVGVAQQLYFDEDRWRVRALGTYLDVQYNFYGIGPAAGDAGDSVLMKQKGEGALGELMYRIHGLWYGGAAYRVLKLKSTFQPNAAIGPSDIPADQLDTRVASLGPRILRDSRNNTDYPRNGSLFDFRTNFNADAVGSDLTYQSYNLSYNHYFTLSPTQVLAVRGAGCVARGNVPFFNECVLTQSENLRGYRASRYMDNAMLASQAEYRVEVWKRVGAAAFFGIGEVGPRLPDFNWKNVLPGGGIGGRYRITPKGHVNVRFDYAWGKDSRQAYFFLGEAF